MALLGDRISAEDAQRSGLIWRCVEDADLKTEAVAIATRLAQLNRGAAKRTRTLFDQATSAGFDEQLDAERAEVRTLVDRRQPNP